MEAKLKRQLDQEREAINRTAMAFKLKIKATRSLTKVGGDQVVIYGLECAAGQAISDIDKRLPEFSEAISTERRKKTPVRLLQYPLRFEVQHPSPKPLLWSIEALEGQPHRVMLGRSYEGGAYDLWVTFDDARHILVAGATGAGKSVLVANMLLSLCWSTSPKDLRLVLIDFKNTDLRSFERLPHSDGFFVDIAPATRTLKLLERELKSREASGNKWPRIVIAIDEYTDLVSSQEATAAVSEIARKGRSHNINIVAATQHPTAKALGDSTIKSNFLVRCVGQVTDANAAQNAAGRPMTHAELLPGNGAFIYVRGQDLIRFQSYYFTDIDVESVITRSGRKWRDEKFAPLALVQEKNHASLVYAPPAPPVAPVLAPPAPVQAAPVAPLFPLREKRPLTQAEAVEVRRLADNGATKNGLCIHVYGSKSTRYMDWINAALGNESAPDEKIIRLRKTGTGGD